MRWLLAAHPALTTIRISDANAITDAGLMHLVGLKTLRLLELTNCDFLTDEGFAAFRKARPDVTVTR